MSTPNRIARLSILVTLLSATGCGRLEEETCDSDGLVQLGRPAGEACPTDLEEVVDQLQSCGLRGDFEIHSLADSWSQPAMTICWYADPDPDSSCPHPNERADRLEHAACVPLAEGAGTLDLVCDRGRWLQGEVLDGGSTECPAYSVPLVGRDVYPALTVCAYEATTAVECASNGGGGTLFGLQ